MNDQEYLAQAGITETGTSSEGAAPAEAAPLQTEAAPKEAVETFEVGDYKLPANVEFKLTHDGKIVKVPVSNMVNSYRQASHFQNKWAQEYKPKIDEFEKLRPEFDKYKGFYDKYGTLQEWSEKNPQSWDVLQKVWKDKEAHLLGAQVQTTPRAAQSTNPNAPNFKPIIDEIAAMKAQLSEFKSVKDNIEQTKVREREESDTKAVLADRDNFQKEYPEINLNERDPEGVTLWAKIMKFGIDSRIPDFESAALKFLKPRLQDTWASRARNEAVKGLKADNKAGIIKRSVTPITGQKPEAKIDPKKMSYSQLSDWVKENIASFETA